MSTDRNSASAFSILVVCTGNVCRSAFAERLGRGWLEAARGAAAGQIALTSAGTRAVVGAQMHPDSALVLAGYGADPGDFRARQLTEAHVVDADLVLTMTRAHREHVLGLAPRALSRTFTLREAADLLTAAAPALGPETGPFARAAGVVAALSRARSRRHAAGDDDVPDPIGRPIQAHEQAGELITGAFLPLLQALTGPPATGAAGTGAHQAASSDGDSRRVAPGVPPSGEL